MVTGKQLRLSDKILIDNQHKSRLKNHPHSTKAKASVQKYHHSADIAVGSLVYIINDGDKTQSATIRAPPLPDWRCILTKQNI